MEKFTRTNAERYIRNNNDAQVAQLGHVNYLKQTIEDNTPYLYYIARLDQATVIKPPDTIRETYITEYVNTLGVPVTWVSDGPGFFYALLPSISIDSVILSNLTNSSNSYIMDTIVGGGATFSGKISLTKDNDYSPCDIFLYCQDNLGNSVDFTNIIADAGYIIEFKVLKPNYTPTLVQTISEIIP